MLDVELFPDGGPYHIETSPLCKSMDWFLYDRDYVMKELICSVGAVCKICWVYTYEHKS